MKRRKFPRVALSALVLSMTTAIAMLVSPAASGQKENRVAEEIGQVLESFERLNLDPAEAQRAAREEGTVTLQTARGTFELEVEPFDVRSDDYRAVAAGEGGVMTELPRTPSNSWRGRVRGKDGTFVRLILDGQQVQGLIITPAETFFVEPARDLSKAAGAKEFVFYSASSVKPTDATCAEATLAGKVGAEVARAGLDTGTHASSATAAPKPDDAFSPKPEARIATEADFEFFQANGSNQTTTNNDILNIITQADGIYDAQLGVKLRVVFQRVWTTATDPYNPTESGAALNEFTNVYDTTFGTNPVPSRDLTHLFTGKDMDGSTIGIAWRGSVCVIPTFAYGISQSRFTATNSLRVALTAHEMGHNFGATHPNTESVIPPNCNPSIMNSFVQDTQNFCQFSRDQITSHLTGDGGSCLARLTTPGCSYSITPTSKFYTIAGGSGTVNITATAGCTWGLAEGAPWLTFTNEAGTGNGSTSYTVAPNDGKDGPRRAFVDIGGKQLAISQPGSPACMATATPISIGQTLSGTLASTDCITAQPNRLTAFEDVYTFVARAGQRVRIELSTSGTPRIDTYLYLFGPDGTLVDENDDIVLGSNTNSRIPADGTFKTLPQTGVYTIAATTFDSSTPGSYTLKLSDNASNNSVSLSSSSYTVDEGTGGDGLGVDGTGFRVVTVTRSGADTTGAATIDYATSDGTASKQKDYTQALGTLVFAPNETSKTFTIFVDDDAFQEGAETVNLTLSNPVGTTLGVNQTATLTINSNDGVSGPSPVRADAFNTAFFVRQQYLDFFSREPDASGFNFWQNEINQCGADAQCREVKRINVSAAFFVSIEFQETGYLVYRMYKTAYGDATSPNVAGTVPVVRLNEFLPDTQRIGQNIIVGAPNWEQQLEANKQAFALEFVLRPRFLTAFPLSMTSAQFVDKLVQNAGITLTTVERDALIAQFSLTADVSAARATVFRQVAENQQLRDSEFRRAFVLMQYYGYLRRNPDDPQDVNFAGWKFWLDKLNQFNGNYVQAEMVKAFITSDEYIDRFGTR